MALAAPASGRGHLAMHTGAIGQACVHRLAVAVVTASNRSTDAAVAVGAAAGVDEIDILGALTAVVAFARPRIRGANTAMCPRIAGVGGARVSVTALHVRCTCRGREAMPTRAGRAGQTLGARVAIHTDVIATDVKSALLAGAAVTSITRSRAACIISDGAVARNAALCRALARASAIATMVSRSPATSRIAFVAVSRYTLVAARGQR